MQIDNAKRTINRHLTRLKKAVQRLQGRQFIHFLHIGKTGGSSVKFALRQFAEGHMLSTRRALTLDHKTTVLIHPHRVTLADVPAGQPAFFFLRDPVSRFVSGFYSRLREARPRIYVPWSPDEAEAFRHFKTPNELALALASSDPQRRAQAEHAMRSIGHVNTFFSKWLISEEYLQTRITDVFYIGFQETLSDDFIALCRKLKLPETIALPVDEVRTHKTPSSFDKTLEPQAVAILKQWYSEDYRFITACRAVIASRGCGLVPSS